MSYRCDSGIVGIIAASVDQKRRWIQKRR